MTKRTPIRDERGQILIITALSMTLLLGIAALSIDASFIYDKRNQLYAAADAAAKIGASEVHRLPAVTQGALDLFAKKQVESHGLTYAACGTSASGTAVTCINHPPLNGPFAANVNYVEAIVTQVTDTFFGRVLGFANMTPGARAVAGVSFGTGCLTALGSGSPGITINNPSTGSGITGTACDVLDAGNLDDGGKITAHSVGYAGTCFSGCPPGIQAPAPTDPLISLPVPTAADCNSGLPGTNVTVGGATPLTPGTYHNIQFQGGVLTMAGGLYCVTGNITANVPGSNVNWIDSGGVTIYIGPAGSLVLDSNHVNITLEAQTSGIYKGIIFFQDRSNTTAVELSKNDGTMTVDGALYFPSATITMKNENFGTSNSCGIIIAQGVNMDKPNMTLADQCASFGGSPISTVSVAE